MHVTQHAAGTPPVVVVDFPANLSAETVDDGQGEVFGPSDVGVRFIVGRGGGGGGGCGAPRARR